MTLWAVAIGERIAYREAGDGVEHLRSLPLLLLHRQRVVVLPDRALGHRALGALGRRFPDARLIPFPGGPDDGLLVDSSGLEEVLAAYGLGGGIPRPETAAGEQLLEWVRGAGEAELPENYQEATRDCRLIPAVMAALSRGQVEPARALELMAALATDTALDFLAWALDGEDPEFQAKFGRQMQAAQAALARLPEEAVLPFAQRLFRSVERPYSIRTLKACAEQLRRIGNGEALHRLADGHPLERQIRRWAEEA